MAKEKQVVVSFRVDRHLADFLDQVPDKSSFIRDVILRSFYATCPVCRGRGVLPEEVSRWADRQIRASRPLECHCCLYEYPRSTVRAGGRTAGRGRFVCPHCRTHGHGH